MKGPPIGSIMEYVGEEPPDGWQICDGSVIEDPFSPMYGERAPCMDATGTLGASPSAEAGMYYLVRVRSPLTPLQTLAQEAE